MKPKAPPLGTSEYGHNCDVKMGLAICFGVMAIIMLAMTLVGFFNPPSIYYTLFPVVCGGLVRWLDWRWPT